MFDPLISSLSLIKAGQLRALAVTTARRSEMLPEVPALGEFLPGYEAFALLGIGAPKNTPTEIIDTLNKQISAALVDSKMKERLFGVGASPVVSSPAEFSERIAKDTEKWRKVILDANIRVD